MTRLVRRLETKGYLTREVEGRDRRFVVLKPTTKARRAAQGIASEFRDIRRELFAEIREGDLVPLSEVLAQLQKNAVRVGSAHSTGRSLHRDRTSRAKSTNQESANEARQVAFKEQLSMVLRESEKGQPSLELHSET